jgi:phytoene dehydrogenase-like protein
VDKVAQPFTSLERLATNKVNYSQGYPRKGLKALLNAILYSFPDTVEIKSECEVTGILVESEKVYGVEADDIYLADLIIYTGFATDLPELIKDLPQDCSHQKPYNLARAKRGASRIQIYGLRDMVQGFCLLGNAYQQL